MAYELKVIAGKDCISSALGITKERRSELADKAETGYKSSDKMLDVLTEVCRECNTLEEVVFISATIGGYKAVETVLTRSR